jgi:hypothetical protein
MIRYFVEPRKVYSWQQFCQEKPQFSIALDGLVNDSTQRDANGPYANFDHHSIVDRISTRSTAEQIHMEINLGLFERFRKNGKPFANVFINDCDEDTTLSIWLLQNYERVIGHADPLINRLVYCNDRLDCTAGSYPFGDISQLRKMAWIFDPYRKARGDSKYAQATESEMRTICEAVFHRINQYCLGNSEELSIETKFEVLGGGKEWSLVRESSTASRMVMFSSGINSFVSVLGNGRYVIGRRSTWTRFPLDLIFKALNEKEGTPNLWGGSNTIGGSLREPSRLTQDEITEVINEVLKKSE